MNRNNLFVCIITLQNNNKLYLVCYSYKHVAFLRVFLYIKQLSRSDVVHTFFESEGNSVDETMLWQHLDQYINIYLHRECCKTSFICFVVTAENLI